MKGSSRKDAEAWVRKQGGAAKRLVTRALKDLRSKGSTPSAMWIARAQAVKRMAAGRKPASKGGTKRASRPRLYQGHFKAGIGFLRSMMPGRRDGDGDTVVAERQPRKSDRFRKSPHPIPAALARRLAPKAKRMARAAKAMAAKPRRASKPKARSRTYAKAGARIVRR